MPQSSGSDHPPRRGLSPARRALLAKMLKQKGMAAPGEEQKIPRRSDPGPAPLSFAQEALWFLDQLEPNEARSNQPGAVRLSGQLDMAALEKTLGEIIARHEPLRMSIEVRDGRPYQVVTAPEPFQLSISDLSDRALDAAEQEATRLATEDAHRPFDLARGPLFRTFVMRLAEHEHILVLNFHHIATDGWSMGVFTEEFKRLYRAFQAGKPSPLAELPIQMGDFAAWQRETLQGDKLEEHLAYWREQLSGELISAEVPLDHPRPAVQSFKGRHAAIQLSKELSDRLRKLSQEQGVTLFMTLNAAFLALLHETGKQTDMLIGSAVAHRNRSELEGLIGFLVNMLALRTDLSGNPGFDELLQRVRTTTIGAWSHQDLPLTQILAQVQPGRDLGRNPLFQVQFSLLTPDRNPAVYGYGLEMGQIETIELPGLVMSPVEVKFDNARYDIAIFLWDMPEGIEGTLEYSRDLFEPSTMERFVERYKTLLNCVLANPQIRLQELVLSLQESDSTAEQEAADHLKASTQAKLKGLRKRSGRRSRSQPEDPS